MRLKKRIRDAIQTIVNPPLKRVGLEAHKFEPRITRDDILRKFIPSSAPVIFDVGANIGQSALRFKSVFPDSTVHSFEPSPINYAKLQEATQGFSGVHIHNVGVGDREGKLEFKSHDAKGATSSFLELSQEGKYTRVGRHVIDVREVEVVTIDDFCRRSGIERIDFLKLDTQGMNLKCLVGASDMIAQCKVSLMQVEFLHHRYYEGQEDWIDLLVHIRDHGFRFLNFVNTDTDVVCCGTTDFDTLELLHIDALFVRS